MISTAPFFRQPLQEAFRHFADAGFESVEVMVTQDPSTQEAYLLSGLAREFGLTVVSIHAPFLLLTRRVWGTGAQGKVERAVRLAREVGASVVVAHPPFRWQTESRRWLQEDLPDLGESAGITVALENMFPVKVSARVGVRAHAAVSFEDLDGFASLVLDTSHAAVAGLDVREVYAAHRDRIRHVHLSNNPGRGWDAHLPIHLDGVLPIPEFLGDLVASGFDGAVVLEYDLRPWMRDDQALHEVLVRNRELGERHLARTAARPPSGRAASNRGRAGD